MGELEIEEVSKAILSGWITTGPRTKELEKRLELIPAKVTKVNYEITSLDEYVQNTDSFEQDLLNVVDTQ